MVNETWKRRRRERGRARRYDPMAEPVQLPEGFIGKIRGALQVAVSDLRECVSWLDREIGTPMLEVGVTLHLNREYGKPGEADADDIVADVWFDDPHGGRNRQRFTWVYSDQRMKDEGGRGRMKDEGGRMKDEGGRMKKGKGRVALAAEAVAARVEELVPAVPALPDSGAVDAPVLPDVRVPEVGVPQVDFAPEPGGEFAGVDGSSGDAELIVDDAGCDEVGVDIEVGIDAGVVDEVLEAEVRGESVEVPNPGADATWLAGGDCGLHDSDLCAPTVLDQMMRIDSVPEPRLADCERAPRVVAVGWRLWWWTVAVLLLLGAAAIGMRTDALRTLLRLGGGRETVHVHVERAQFGVNVEEPF